MFLSIEVFRASVKFMHQWTKVSCMALNIIEACDLILLKYIEENCFFFHKELTESNARLDSEVEATS